MASYDKATCSADVSSPRIVEIHAACLPVDLLLAECEVIRQRRSGPGGQHRNKVETAIRLRHLPTGITAEASERRSQAANQSMAVRRMRLNLAVGVRTPPGPPSERWRTRCRGGMLSISTEHDDFPALVAEALDHLSAHDWNLQQASHGLACSPSQLTKLLRKHPPALALLNRERTQAGLSSLQ